MKILLLTDDLFPGGVQRHVTDLANRLARRGHTVSVAASHGSFIGRLNRTVEFVDVPLARNGPRSPLKFWKAFRMLKALVDRRRYEVIHSHQRYTDALGRLLAWTSKKPHVSTCHSLFDHGRWYSHFGMETIAVSQTIKKMLEKSFGKSPESVTVIYNELAPLKPLSLKKRHRLIAKFHLGEARKILFSVGRFVPDKDPFTTLDALNILKERGKLDGIVCIMVGRGELQEKITGMITAFSLEEHVLLLPPTTDVAEIFSVADFGILSSVREGGIPYAVLEAASLGKPVVASETGGVLEFISHMESGMLLPPKNPKALADSIQFLIENPSMIRKLGLKAKKEFTRSHVSNGSVEKTLEIYRKAIKRHRR